MCVTAGVVSQNFRVLGSMKMTSYSSLHIYTGMDRFSFRLMHSIFNRFNAPPIKLN